MIIYIEIEIICNWAFAIANWNANYLQINNFDFRILGHLFTVDIIEERKWHQVYLLSFDERSLNLNDIAY